MSRFISELKAAWVGARQRAFHQGTRGIMTPEDRQVLEEEFDRKLAEVKAEAWAEGANAVTCEWRLHPERGDAIVKHAQVRTRRPANPYRKEPGNE